MAKLLVFLVALVPLTLAVSPAACQFKTSHECIAQNDLRHPLPFLAHVPCIWCERGDSQRKAAHCTSLEEVQSNTHYHSGWACNFAEFVAEDSSPATPHPTSPRPPSHHSNHNNHHSNPNHHVKHGDKPKHHTTLPRHHDQQRHHIKGQKPHPVRSSPRPVPVTDSDPYGGGSMNGGGGGGGGGGKMMGGGGGGGNNGGGKMMGGGGGKMMNGGGMMEGPFSKLIDELKQKAPKPLQFLGGLAMGVLGKLAGINPSKVVMGLDQVTTDLEGLFNGFKLTPDGLKNTVSNVANTIRDMSTVLNDAGLHDLANKATKAAAVADKVEGWVVKGEQILYKGVNIYQDLQQALKDFQDGNYFEVGQDIGNIISVLHPSTPSTPPVTPPTPPVSPPVQPPQAPTAAPVAGTGMTGGKMMSGGKHGTGGKMGTAGKMHTGGKLATGTGAGH